MRKQNRTEIIYPVPKGRGLFIDEQDLSSTVFRCLFQSEELLHVTGVFTGLNTKTCRKSLGCDLMRYEGQSLLSAVHRAKD